VPVAHEIVVVLGRVEWPVFVAEVGLEIVPHFLLVYDRYFGVACRLCVMVR
jgi:hypothetical protein